MSTTSEATADDGTSSSTFLRTTESLQLEYAVTHVFLPVPSRRPCNDDHTAENDHSLARAVCAASHAYETNVCRTSEQAQWHRTTKMLDYLQASVQTEHMDHDLVISQLREMQTGGRFEKAL